jgi:WD40 repeat protein
MSKGKDQGEPRTLNKRHAFGIKSDVYGCLNWLDEHTLTYPVGRNVVIHNVSSNAQKFFLTSEKTESITAIALSPNKKYIAIAESGEHPQIQIVDTSTRKRRRVLSVSDLGSDKFVAVEFSADGRHLVTQGGHPSWNLLYWNWERSKPLAQVRVEADPGAADRDKFTVTKVSINPKDPLHIVVSGNGIFRFYRYVDSLLKPSPGGPGKNQTTGANNYTTHSWVTDDRIVLANDKGDLFYLQDNEFQGQLACSPGDDQAIMSIEPTSRGFVCGAKHGHVHIFEAADDKDVYRKVKTVTLENNKDLPEEIAKDATINAFALTHGEDTLAVATSTRQIYGLKFTHEWARGEVPVFSSICQPAHALAITGLDTCVRKPLVATCSLDHTVRIWNIQDHTVEIIKHFPKQGDSTAPQQVALHPSGLHILVCFQDKVRFLNLHGESMNEFRVFSIRQSTDVRFSIGGQYFAVVHSNTIQVFNTYTCEQLGSLRANGPKITAMQWASTTHFPLDTRIVACTQDGMVLDWSLREMRKEADHMDKRYKYDAIAADDKCVWVVGTPTGAGAGRDGPSETKYKVKLREIESVNMHGETVSNDYEFPDLEIKNLALASAHRLLFGGCSDGSIKLMTFPLQGGIHDPPILAHADEVSRIAVSYDENMFFSVGKDGSFYLFDIKEDGRSAKRETIYADEILISRGDLEDKAATTGTLHQSVQELTHDMEYNEKRRGTQHDERVKEATNKFQEDAEKQAQQFAAVWNSKLDQEKEFADKKRKLADEYSNACAESQRRFDEQVKDLERQCAERRATVKEWQEVSANNRKELADSYEQQRQNAEESFLSLMMAKKDLITKTTNLVDRNRAEQDEKRSQLEADTDTEIENVKRKYEQAITRERETYLHMKGENAIYKKAAMALTKEKEKRDAEVRALDATKEELNGEIAVLKTKHAKLTSEIDEKDQTIAEREKKIYELKKKNQELEKHKFVLDHTIRQYKSQIEPRQMQIARGKEKIQEKDQELEQFHKNNLTLRDNIGELRDQITAQQTEIKQLLNKLKDFETYRGRVKTDIGELAQLVQDPELLRQGIDKVFHDHVLARGGKRTAPLAAELKAEFQTHTDFLGRTVESLKRKVAEDHTAHRGQVSSVMTDNLKLIGEINELRKDIAKLKTLQPDGAAGAGQSTVGASTMHMPNSTFGGSPLGGTLHQDPAIAAAQQREIENNRAEMLKLRTKIEELEKSIAIRSQPRPGSRDRHALPPLHATH